MIELTQLGELPVRIPLEGTMFHEVPSALLNLRPNATGEDKSKLIRELANTTVTSRRSILQKQWDELKVQWDSTLLQAIDFATQATNIVPAKGQKKREDPDVSSSEDVHMRAWKGKRQTQGTWKKQTEKTQEQR